MGLLFYSFSLLPCVRVRCGPYPHGLTDLLFWLSPLCESPLRTVSTWAYSFPFLVFSLVRESVVDCIHISLLLYYLCWLPCARVRCGLYSHGFIVSLFWFVSLCESPLRTVST